MKIAANKCYGGFRLSRMAIDLYKKYSGVDKVDSYSVSRNDEILIKVVEELGELASNFCSAIQVIEIPDGIEWEIDEYDGFETIREKHRSW